MAGLALILLLDFFDPGRVSAERNCKLPQLLYLLLVYLILSNCRPKLVLHVSKLVLYFA